MLQEPLSNQELQQHTPDLDHVHVGVDTIHLLTMMEHIADRQTLVVLNQFVVCQDHEHLLEGDALQTFLRGIVLAQSAHFIVTSLGSRSRP